MQVKVSGKQVDIGTAFQEYAEQLMADLVEKYFDQGLDATVTVSRAHQGLKVDISVHASRSVQVQSQGEGNTAHLAFDAALARIAKRLRRYKRRLKDHNRREKSEAKQNVLNAQRYVIEASETIADAAEDDELLGDNPAVVAEMSTEISTLSVSDAVMRLDLSDSPVLMFRNAVNGSLNVVYRRQDGNIGWIDPQTGTDAADAATS